MIKKVIIEAVLVPETIGRRAQEIEKEILKEFQNGSLLIPWCDKVEKIRVVEKL